MSLNLSINGGYLQIAGLAILQLASIVLKVDIFESSLDDISSSLNVVLMFIGYRWYIKH